ncbi:hypothetical protein [uncultured Paraglaciecola sp.]|uniref:hypothetical protein n=1 Tax=uncultured Paraglaciecola sp. TaxID=1765024 RepID=UPI0030D955F3|tara:strand:- start:4901 stop:5806 length:906 start_codon:yes stop_codon:yes gene_type:complete
MTCKKTKPNRTSALGVGVLLMIFLISSCEIEAAPVAQSPSDVSVAVATQNNSNASSVQLWEGVSAGYTTQGDPTKEDVAFLIVLGHVHAAIGRANHHEKEVGMKNPFTPQLLQEYGVIDPFVSGQSSSNLSLQPLLSTIAAPETFSILMDQSPATRQQRNTIHTQLKALILRVDAIVNERFPSIHTSALAMSAMFREAALRLRTALSEEGKIVDTANYRDALQLMEASLRLRVNKAIMCDRSRNAIKQLQGRGPLGDLLDRLIIVSTSGTVNANAGDVFDAAHKLELLGTNLPNDDSDVCP